MGKSTLGASLPKPILIDFDKGADQLKVDRLEGPKTWLDTLALLREIGNDPQGYESLVIDTIDPLEEQATDHVCAVGHKPTIADFGYGAGYEALAAEWRNMLAELDFIRSKGLTICLLAHSVIRTAQDPQLGQYDQFTVQLQKKTWAATQRWCDLVGFAAFDAAIKKEERRAIVSGDRVLYTSKGSGFEAKNRFGMPEKMPLGWEPIAKAIEACRQKAGEVEKRILELAKGTEHEEKARGFVEHAAGDVRKLLQIEDALRVKLEGAA